MIGKGELAPAYNLKLNPLNPQGTASTGASSLISTITNLEFKVYSPSNVPILTPIKLFCAGFILQLVNFSRTTGFASVSK